MQTRVRTRLRRYYFSPLPSVHVPQGTASALPQVRFRLQVAAIVRTGLQRASVVAPGQAGLCFSVRVIIVPRFLSGWLSRLVSCLNYRHQPVFVAASPRLAGVPPQSRFRATSTRPLLPLSYCGGPVAFSTVSRSCWSLLLSLLHVTTDAIPTTDAVVFAFAILAASRPVGAL